MKKLILGIILFLGILVLGSQFVPHSDTSHKVHLMEKIKAHKDEIHYEAHDHSLLDTTLLLKVHSNIPDVANFFTEKVTENLTHFPCSNCHKESLKVMQSNGSSPKQKAHWNIQLDHANMHTMNCTTCHSEDNMNNLASLTGEMIDLDESYKLCAQCHSTQHKDWQGGAHGKQLNGWKPPRVAKTCVSCHNPHKPAFPSRFPARLNTYQSQK